MQNVEHASVQRLTQGVITRAIIAGADEATAQIKALKYLQNVLTQAIIANPLLKAQVVRRADMIEEEIK